MIRISHPTSRLEGTFALPASKSISNRLLILRALYAPDWSLQSLSEARDTQLMKQALVQTDSSYNLMDAGTAMRFLTAFLSTTNGQYELRGTQRMHQRPIAELVDALRHCGAKIRYLDKEGFPPLSIEGASLKARQIDLRSVRSSQFISAILMILPTIEGPCDVLVDPGMHSWSFVELTMDCMRLLGFDWQVSDERIRLAGSFQHPEAYTVEADWTSFYYGFTMAVLSKAADLFFPHLYLDGLQSERKWLSVLSHPLLQVEQQEQGIRLIRKPGAIQFSASSIDLKAHPDLAPTFAILFSGLGQSMEFVGLELLQYKESDRDLAIGELLENSGASWTREGDKWLSRGKAVAPESVLRSHDDHRMFMAAAALGARGPVYLDDPAVCEKSFPSFTDQLRGLGFLLEASPSELR